MSIYPDFTLFFMSIYPDFTFFIQLALFLLCFWAMKTYLFPPVLEVLLKRQTMIERAQRELREHDEQGKKMQQDYQEEIRKTRVAAQEIRNQARRDLADYERDALEKARLEELHLLEEGRKKIEQQQQDLEAQFAKDRNQIVNEIVSKALGRPIA